MPRSSGLDPDAELIVREFLTAARRMDFRTPPNLYRFYYDLMGYKITPQGTWVHKDIKLQQSYFGKEQGDWRDTYHEDGKTLARDQADADTSASEPTEGD